MIHGVDVRIKMYRYKPQLLMMSAEDDPNYKIGILEAVFIVLRVSVHTRLALSHPELFEKGNGRYAMTRTDLKMNTMACGSLIFSWDSMYPALRPSNVVIGLLKQRAINGDYKSNPFDFQKFNVSEVHLSVNGIHIMGSPIKLDFGNLGANAMGYTNLFQMYPEKKGELAIRKSDFDNSTTLYALTSIRVN